MLTVLALGFTLFGRNGSSSIFPHFLSQDTEEGIEEEQAKLKQQQTMWNRMIEQKASLQDTLKEVHIDNGVKKTSKRLIRFPV